MANLNGIDISNWQSDTPTEYDFCIIKASEGVGYTDPSLNKHYNAWAKTGKPYGFYHYARPDLGNTAAAEADWFLSLVGHHAGKALFCLDFEGKALSWGSNKKRAAWCLAFLERVYEKTGCRGLLYIQGSAYSTGAYDYIYDANYGIWAASPSSYYRGHNITVQQSVYDNLDHDVFYGDTATWNKYCNPGSSSSSTTAEPTGTTTVSGTTLELAVKVMAGDYGTGDDRKNALGDRYDEVQNFINHIYSASVDTLATEVRAGKYGNGDIRKAVLGNRYDEVQAAVNNSSTKKYHTVVKGDTLSAIATVYGTTINQLMAWNTSITNANLIYVGQKIRVK